MLKDCLKGARVLDLSQYIPGPFAALLLSDFGADVVKIEPPQGDPMRSFGPIDGDGLSPFYKAVNRNKTVVCLDLKSAEGKAAFERLAAKADVIVESFRPGVMDRLGFGPERLRTINPGLVHCALSGFGQTGPYRLRAGHDLTYMALTGALAATGTPERPVIPYPPVADHAGAMHAVMAVLAALVRKERTGQGAHLDLSLFESALHMNYLGLTLGLRGQLEREEELLNGGAAYYRIYRCADGRFAALGAIEAKFWAAFCQSVGKPEWMARQGEPFPQTALIEELSALFAGQPLAHWEEVLSPADCCFEPVLEASGVLADPHVQARGLLHATAGAEAIGEVAFPAHADGAPPPPRVAHRELAAEAVADLWPT